MSTCNEKATIETIMNTGESRKTIDGIIGHYSQFIASKIKEGSFESVRVLHFGIFQAKLKELQIRSFIKALPKSTTRKP